MVGENFSELLELFDMGFLYNVGVFLGFIEESFGKIFCCCEYHVIVGWNRHHDMMWEPREGL